MTSEHLPPLVQSSINLIAQHQSSTGAYVAAPNYGTYAFSWLRDGAFIAAAADKWGRHESAAAFHLWATRTIESYAHKVADLEANTAEALAGTGDPLQPIDDRFVLHTRFTVDGSEDTAAWGNFQLDGYGFWLTSVANHITRTGCDPAPYLDAICLASRYLQITWQHPCYDSWEEYPTRCHLSTWAAVAKGLRSAGRLTSDDGALRTAVEIVARIRGATGADNTLRKFAPEPKSDRTGRTPRTEERNGVAVAGHERLGQSLPSDSLDGSALLVLGSHGPFQPDDRIVSSTLEAIEQSLVVDGGVHRYRDDEYYGGGLWIVLAGALADVQATHDPDRARATLSWIERQADGAGYLGEQSSAVLRNPATLEPWIQRWGAPASPLLWSHAMYLLAIDALDRSTG